MVRVVVGGGVFVVMASALPAFGVSIRTRADPGGNSL